MTSAKIVVEQVNPNLVTEVFEYKLIVGNAPGAKGDTGPSGGIDYTNPIAANSTGTITPVDGAYYTSTASSVTLVSLGDERFCPASLNVSGTTDGTTASKLVDSTQDFDADGTEVGDVVLNTTDSTRAEITNIDSSTTLSISADIMVSGENYEIHKGNRVIWGMGVGAAAVLDVDPVKLSAGESFAIQLECGESRIISYDGTDFEKIGGVVIKGFASIDDFAVTNTYFSIVENTDTPIPMNNILSDNTNGLMADTDGIYTMRPGVHSIDIDLIWTDQTVINSHQIQNRAYVDVAFLDATAGLFDFSALARSIAPRVGDFQLNSGVFVQPYARQNDPVGTDDLTIFRGEASHGSKMTMREIDPW